MRRRTWLTGVGLLLALGPGASSAMANSSDVRVGAGQLLISEFEPVAPDVTEDANDVRVTRAGGTFTVTDTSQGAIAGGGCLQVDLATVTCSANSVTRITVQLKGGADTLDIADTIAEPATVAAGRDPDTITTGGGGDTVTGEAGADIINTRSGDDSIDTYGETSPEADTITCGAGTDSARVDLRDGFIPAASRGECETVTNPDQPPPPPPPAPNPGGGGGGGPVVNPNQTAVQPLQPGTNPPTPLPPAPSTIACRSQTFVGTTSADRFVGTTGGDRMVGLAGNDLFDGLAGEDCIYGGDGNDSMRGGDGDDRLSGGDGNDRGDGGNGADGLYGSAGVDTLYGRAGNDVVSGGLGSDKMFGEAGADRMTGSAGNDRLSAGAGNDRIVAGTGRDQVYGSSGNDLIDVRDGARDVVSCGPGRDTVVRDRRDVLRNCERTASRLPRAR
jgi:Ca2+-binding RTX toxin-like protein